MVAKTNCQASGRNRRRQPALFDSVQDASPEWDDQVKPCQIVDVGKRRDGKTRYWCVRHRADATAKSGQPAATCRAAHIPPIRAGDVLSLDLDRYEGGVALWGAVPAVFDTTRLPMDRGIHVHARLVPGGKKVIDSTYRAVRILGRRLPAGGIVVSEVDAIYYMVSSVFGFTMSYVTCSHCQHPHLDRDYFSVRPHRRHLCAGCGKYFRDTEAGIGNPIVGVRNACGSGIQVSTPSEKALDISQCDFPGGIQIWGSNPAFLWTGSQPEEEGIHVHAFREESEAPDEEDDETYGRVVIDGFELDPVTVRIFMAQSVLPSLKGRVRSLGCARCGEQQFGVGEAAFTPSAAHECSRCHSAIANRGRLRKSVANPLPALLASLARAAPRPPQRHDIELLTDSL